MASSATSRAAKELARSFESGVLLTHTHEKEKPPPNPKGWWISEKLSGVRAYWNGEDFFTRTGTRIHAPGIFKEGLPANVHLDGEPWIGREAFKACVGIVRSTDASGRAEEWRVMKSIMLDGPVVDGKVGVPYEARHTACEAAAEAEPFASAVAIRGRPTWSSSCATSSPTGARASCSASRGDCTSARGPTRCLRSRRSSTLRPRSWATPRIPGWRGCMGVLGCKMPVTGVRFKVGSGFTQAQRPHAAARKEWPVKTDI